MEIEEIWILRGTRLWRPPPGSANDSNVINCSYSESYFSHVVGLCSGTWCRHRIVLTVVSGFVSQGRFTCYNQ